MSWVVLSFAGAVVVLDQATKALAVRFLSPAANRRWWLGGTPTPPVLFGLWTLVVCCTVLAYATAPPAAVAGLVVALAGATSNLGDRLGRGAVIDFIALGRWPTFNLADVAIAAGVGVALGASV